MTARASTSSLSGRACGLLWILASLACGRDAGDLFEPVAAVPAAGAPAMPPQAAPAIAATDSDLASAGGRVSEAGPTGSLPVAPAPPASGDAASEAAPVAPAASADVNPARVCPAPEQPLLLDFASAESGPVQALFGDFNQFFSGGTFVYPPSSGDPNDPATVGLVSDVTGGDWHVTGRVVEPSGFGLFFNCQLLDATPFAGVAFRIGGQVGPEQRVTLRLRTAGNEVAREWFIDTGNGSPATFGRCYPELGQYDGTCEPARVDVAVSPEGGEVVVRFGELGGGLPEDTVNPAELTAIEWSLPLVGGDAGVASYEVDLRIDDIRFVEAE